MIMPDIEMRLEAFVRVGHAIVVFPGVRAPLKKSSTSLVCSWRLRMTVCLFP